MGSPLTNMPPFTYEHAIPRPELFTGTAPPRGTPLTLQTLAASCRVVSSAVHTAAIVLTGLLIVPALTLGHTHAYL